MVVVEAVQVPWSWSPSPSLSVVVEVEAVLKQCCCLDAHVSVLATEAQVVVRGDLRCVESDSRAVG